MKKILLTQGKYTLVDDEDYDELMQWKWCAAYHPSGGWRVHRKYKHSKTVLMSRFIMNAPKGMDVDHRNGNPMDNRRSNLRVCTHQENCQGRRPNKNCLSNYKGVSWFRGKWRVVIGTNKKQLYLGRFSNEEEAAKVYDTKAKELFGEYAYTNF